LGNTKAARIHLENALEISFANSGFRDADTMYNIGEVALKEKDFQGAYTYLAESLAIARRIGWQSTVAYNMLALALQASATAQDERAAVIHGAADALFEQRGEVPNSSNLDMRQRDHAHLRDVMGAPSFDAAYAKGRKLTTAEAVDAALHGSRAGTAAPRTELEE
jgi:tetratricopeptide (TPR) repeat protein